MSNFDTQVAFIVALKKEQLRALKELSKTRNTNPPTFDVQKIHGGHTYLTSPVPPSEARTVRRRIAMEHLQSWWGNKLKAK